MDSGFFGQSYQSRVQWQEADRLVNLYPETSDKGITGFVGCPGMAQYCALATDSLVRGMHATSEGHMYAISEDTVYSVASGAASIIGTINTTTGTPCFASNSTQVLIVDGTNGYVIDIATAVVTQIASTGFPNGAASCCFIATYFIVPVPNTDQFQFSTQNDATQWDALDFSSAELLGDPLSRVFAGGGGGNDLLLLGTRSTEIFTLVLNATIPFSRVGNSFLEYGIVAPFSIAKIGGKVFWLGASDNGQAVVLVLSGYQLEPISTNPVSKALQSYANLSDAIGFCYQQDNHAFYVLTLPSAQACWVYDTTTNLWHERLSYINGQFSAYRASSNTFYENKHLVGDFARGLIYSLSLDTYDYAGSPRKWLRSWMVPKAENKLVNHSNLMLECDVGVGLTDTSSLYNDAINLFDARYWAIDFPIGSDAVVVAEDETSLTVTGDIRSNRHLIGLIWNSRDKYGHLAFAYQTKKNFTGSIVAFCANPLDPYNFNMTITVGDDDASTDHFYRLFPYENNSGTLECYAPSPAITGPGTGRTYSVATLFPGGLTIPPGQYVYIIDFDDLAQGYSYDGALIDQTNINRFFISLVTENYGVGTNAVLANATAENLTEWHLTNVNPNFVLTAGDQIQFAYSEAAIYKTVNETITTWTGDGTTERFITMANPLGVVTIDGATPLAILLHRDSPTGNESVSFTISNISATGVSSIIPCANHPQPAHSTLMTMGFDDQYNITPWRSFNQMYKLGYRTRMVMYIGASHYYKAYSDFDEDGNWKVYLDDTQTNPYNAPLVAYLQSFFAMLFTAGIQFTLSHSLEVFRDHIKLSWAQLDYQGNIGITGYTPPTAFIAPTNTEATTYMINVFNHGLSLMVAAGLTPDFQLGEFWWWDGTYNNFQPCFYNPITIALYKTETGLDAPLTLQNIFQTPLNSDETGFCTWLGQKLGIMTHTIRDALIAVYPAAQSTLLFFSPQIFNNQAPMLQITNFPVAYWSYLSGKWTKMQIEQYDWVILNQIEKYHLTIEAATLTLGYPIEKVHHFMGFVQSGKTQVWGYINTEYNFITAAGIINRYIWSYPQITSYSMVIDENGHFQPFSSQLDIDPSVSLRVSNDSGKTWGNYLYRRMGEAGEYNVVLRWQRLGRGRGGRAYELSGSNAVKIGLVNVTIDMEVL